MQAGPASPERERKSDRTRRRILDAAADVLNRKGYAGARLTEIAKLADLQVPAEVRQRQLTGQREYGALWRSMLADAVAAGEVDPLLDPHGARMLLIGALNWAPDWWDPARGSVEDVVATAERLVRNALSGN